MTIHNLAPGCILHHADCRDALRALPSDSLDSCVTDPPYALVSIVKRFGSPTAAPAKGNDAYMRASAGFMGKTWDTGETAMAPEFWAEVLRVLKPGAFVAAFGSSRGYHRLACAIEDAGFEIRDSLMYLYGTGFPKSHNVALSIDKAAGAVGHLAKSFNMKGGGDRADEFTDNGRDFSIRHEPATPEAAEWEGFGTALKPAHEPIVLARKPLSEGTVAANVLRWRTGALNIDGCRIPGAKPDTTRGASSKASSMVGTLEAQGRILDDGLGRWPANVVTDGSPEVVGYFPDSAGQQGRALTDGTPQNNSIYGAMCHGTVNPEPRNDSGSAARFFYSAKASKADRAGSKHPTVKPISLMRWLARLITPPGGTILEPFAGSGTTGAAALAEGFRIIMCEREAEYVADIQRRICGAPDPLEWPAQLARHARRVALAEALQGRLHAI